MSQISWTRKSRFHIHDEELLISLDMDITHERRHIGIEEWKDHNWKLKYYYCYFPIITVLMYYKSCLKRI